MSGPHLAGSRRLVVYNDEKGKSRLSADDQAPRVVEYAAPKGMRTSVLWATGTGELLRNGPYQDPVPGLRSVLPGPGNTTFQMLTLAPDSAYAAADFDPLVAASEAARHAPGLAEKFEPDAPGFHRTDTVDYITVLSGEVWIEADEGEAKLSAGDTLVQLGTRHAWRNKTDKPATLAVVMVGVEPL